jgi:hypothetical protein
MRDCQAGMMCRNDACHAESSLRKLTTVGLALSLAACSASHGAIGAADASKPYAPTTLRSFESAAEGISDAAKTPDLAKALAVLGEAQTTWAALVPQLQASGATSARLHAIDTLLQKSASDIQAQSQRAVETDGNAISLAVPDFFDLFSYLVPSDVLRGDGVFRQLQIEAEYSDWTTGQADLQAVQQVWQRLKPLVVDKAPSRPDIPGASTVAADVDNAVMRCRDAFGARDSATLQTAAQDGLDLVDIVEQIFK